MITIEVERLGLRPGARVLDLGCGDGRHARSTRSLPGVATIAVDLGRVEVDAAQRSLRELDEFAVEAGGPPANAGPWLVAQASGMQLPFPDGSFDAVILSEVLEHLEDDHGALEEVARVLRPEGVLALSVPREGPETLCWALSEAYRNTPGGHLRIYRERELREQITAHGFRPPFAAHFAHALHAPYWWMKCLFGLEGEPALPVRWYHEILVWDLMERPWLTRTVEGWLNPWIGKSVVFYATREAPGRC